MKKIIIIISILLIFPSISFAADWAWLLWSHWRNAFSTEDTGSWQLINALNSRNECLDALLKKRIKFYENYLDDPSYEVNPKPNESTVYCLKKFRLASKSKPVSDSCKYLITSFVMDRTNREGVKSRLTLAYASKEARQLREDAHQMKKEGKNSDEITAYLRASSYFEKVRTSKVELWCLPVGVDPKTIGNKY